MAQKKYVSVGRLSTFLDNLKTLFATKAEVSGKADASHTHTISNVTNLQSTLDSKATQTALNSHTSNTDIHFTAAERTKLSGIAAGAQVNTVTGVKGNSESTYRTGNINITKANIGLGNVDNTADANKSVKHATSADSATSATKATQDGNGKVISSTYETKTDAASKLTEAKTYADNAANTVKNDLLNGAGGAYDTLKELGDLIDDNKDAIDALNDVAAGKANATHTHTVANITDLTATADELNYMDGVTSNVQSQLDSKAASSHKHTDLEEDIADLDERMLKKVSKSGDTMTGNLKIQRDDGISPVFSMDATANGSGQRASLNISKNANSSVDNGTEIEDETFDGSTTSLIINRSAKYLADRVRIQERDANYSITEYALYGEHNKPSLYDLGAASSTHKHTASDITSGTMDAARLPKASETVSGIVTTGTQTFEGVKTFTSPIYADGGVSPSESNTTDLGDSRRAFRDTYTKNLYVNPQIVSGSAIRGGAFITEREGTTTTDGLVRLEVGNQIVGGKTGNARGYIKIYNEDSGSVILQTSHDDDYSYRLNLPDHAGTLATKDDLAGLASVSTLTTAEYTALEEAEATNANTLYMLTDAEEEVVPQIQIITWEEND